MYIVPDLLESLGLKEMQVMQQPAPWTASSLVFSTSPTRHVVGAEVFLFR